MLPREKIDRFDTEDGHFLELIRHDNDFYIEIDGTELMSTRRTGSEVQLAEIGCEGLMSIDRPRVLIGGLGFGFTLRAALERLPRHAELVVADLYQTVVHWNRTHLKHLYGDALNDPRLEIVVSDVWDQIGNGPWHSILLDTDNGPEFLCLPENEKLYRDRGLEHIKRSLAPEGLLAVWSADAQPRFVKRLRSAGFEAECRIVRERGKRGQSYAIHLGRLGRNAARGGGRKASRGRTRKAADPWGRSRARRRR